MEQVLIIKTDMRLKQSAIDKYHKMFVDQLKTGVVIIPAYLHAELVNVPTDIEVIVESAPVSEV